MSSSETDISVKVAGHVKSTEGYSAYTKYIIASSTSRAGFTPGNMEVERRYKDFSWLSTELGNAFPGAIVPPLPEKQSVGRFTEEFIESRQRMLQKFLERVAKHPEMSSSKLFIAFLQFSESALEATKQETKAQKPKSSSVNWFEGTINALSVPKPELERSTADQQVEEVTIYINLLEKQLANISKNTDSLIKRSKEVAHCLNEFGHSFSWLGQSEGDTVGIALSELGSTAESLSTAAAEHAEQEMINLLEPMEEYSRMLGSIRTAMQQRQAKKNNYISCLTDVEAKQAAHRKVLGVAGKEAQAESKEQAVRAAQEAAEYAKEEYEKVSERILAEFEFFKANKALDMKEIILSFVNLQTAINRKSEEAWNALMPKIEAIAVADLQSAEEQYMYRTSAELQRQSMEGSGMLRASIGVGAKSSNFQDVGEDEVEGV